MRPSASSDFLELSLIGKPKVLASLGVPACHGVVLDVLDVHA